jgi:hypothetical protein
VAARDVEVSTKTIRKPPPGADVTGRWWLVPDKELHTSVVQVVHHIRENQRYREMTMLENARLYHGRQVMGLGIGMYIRPGQVLRTSGRLAFNVVKSCADTACAKIAKNKPRPLFLTSRGPYALQRKAEWLTQYIEGVYYDAKAYDVGQTVFLDSCVFGTGAMRVFWDYDDEDQARIRVERAHPWELLIDFEDGRYGQPQQMHHVRWMYREQLSDQFPKMAKQIEAAKGLPLDTTSNQPVEVLGARDKVQVVESWHLRSGPNTDDGKHCLVVDGATLHVEPYDAPTFPFVFMRWNPSILDFWGVGLAEELLPIQVEINRTARAIQSAQHLVASPRVFMQHGSQVVPSHLNPGGGDRIPIVKYVGAPPVFQTATAMNAESYQYLESLIKHAYEMTGISQMSAQAQKPEGLNSGVALREYNDTASERFVLTSQRWESFYMDLARLVIDMSRRAYRDGGDRKLRTKGTDGKFLREIKWSDLDPEDDEFRMEVYPTSMLPATPSGKLQTVTDMVQGGLLPQDQALSLLDFPDLERFTDLATAAERNVRRTIERILDDGKPASADDFANLDLCVRIGMEAVLEAEDNGEKQTRIDMLRKWVDACRVKLQPPAPPPAPPGQAGVGAPPQGSGAGGPGAVPAGRPMKAPLSGLRPQVSDELSKMGIETLGNGNTQSGIEGGGPTGMGIDTSKGPGQQASEWATFQQRHPGYSDSGDSPLAYSNGFFGSRHLLSDGDSKRDVHPEGGAPRMGAHPAADSEPARFMDAIEGGKAWRYRPGVDTDDPSGSKQHYGTTTQDISRSDMGRSVVTHDPRTGYQAIDVREAVGPIMASLGNLNLRLRHLEGSSPADDGKKEAA